MNDTLANFFAMFISLIVLGMLLAIILGLPLMLLWNWLMPTIFGFKMITFWQAVGLSFLSNLLFSRTTNINHNK